MAWFGLFGFQFKRLLIGAAIIVCVPGGLGLCLMSTPQVVTIRPKSSVPQAATSDSLVLMSDIDRRRIFETVCGVTYWRLRLICFRFQAAFQMPVVRSVGCNKQGTRFPNPISWLPRPLAATPSATLSKCAIESGKVNSRNFAPRADAVCCYGASKR